MTGRDNTPVKHGELKKILKDLPIPVVVKNKFGGYGIKFNGVVIRLPYNNTYCTLCHDNREGWEEVSGSKV